MQSISNVNELINEENIVEKYFVLLLLPMYNNFSILIKSYNRGNHGL